jgi:hypothetical protein
MIDGIFKDAASFFYIDINAEMSEIMRKEEVF